MHVSRRQCLGLLLSAPWLGALRAAVPATPVVPEFLVLGRTHLFAVHRFLYAPGRDFQVVLRLAVPERIPRRWKRARRREQPALLQCPGLDLRQLRPGRRDRPRSLSGALSLSDGTPLLEGTWPIQSVLVYAQVDPEQARRSRLTYFPFGHGREWYGMHAVGGAPDFEQIVALPGFPDAERLELDLPNDPTAARLTTPERRELVFRNLEWSR